MRLTYPVLIGLCEGAVGDLVARLDDSGMRARRGILDLRIRRDNDATGRA